LTLDYVNIDDEKTRAIVTSLQQTTGKTKTQMQQFKHQKRRYEQKHDPEKRTRTLLVDSTGKTAILSR